VHARQPLEGDGGRAGGTVRLVVPPRYRLPELSPTGDPSHSGAPERIDTVYWDTPDLRLARWGARLSTDGRSGWLATLPQPAGAHRFDGSARPPAEALDLLRAYVRTARLQPVARLRRVRRRTVLTDADGRQTVVVSDDEVSVFEGRRVVGRFRELELEPATAEGDATDGDTGVILADVAELLRRSGAVDADPIAGEQRALGPLVLEPPEVVTGEVVKEATAGEVVRLAVAASVVRLLRHDAGVRLGDDPEDVHQARVATRRLRSDLRSYRLLLDLQWTAALRIELAWLAGLLGAVRDTEVLVGRLQSRLAELPLAPEVDRLIDDLHAHRDEARQLLVQGMQEPRYAHLLDALVDAADRPQLLPEADGPAMEVLPDLLERPWRHLRREVNGLGDDPLDEQLHQVRIRTKRLRYATEAAAPVLGKRAGAVAKAAARLQEVLGDHQDSVVAEGWLRGVGLRASPGEAFAAGELAALEVLEARETRSRWPKAWAELRKSWSAWQARKVPDGGER
jgi:CHAD domain-containing protein